MKIISKEIKDLDRLLGYLERHGYTFEEGTHAVLLDHSEVSRFAIIKNGKMAALALVHYLSPYYRVEMKDIDNEDQYLQELLIVRHSGEKWRIPVEDAIFIVFDDRLEDLLSSYDDYYPVSDGEELVAHYLKHYRRGKEVLKVLLGRVMDELSGG